MNVSMSVPFILKNYSTDFDEKFILDISEKFNLLKSILNHV